MASGAVPACRHTAAEPLPDREQELVLLDDRARCLRLFPNAIPVTGLKHISDNLLGSILQSLSQSLANFTLSTCCCGFRFPSHNIGVLIMLCMFEKPCHTNPYDELRVSICHLCLIASILFCMGWGRGRYGSSVCVCVCV